MSDPLNSIDTPADPNQPLIMGILNVTPDSFYDGGRYNRLEDAVARARELVESGADVLDIGGESTRPGSTAVSVEEEIDRVIPVVEALVEDGIPIPISVDTRHGPVAERALEAGGDWINDVTGLRGDDRMVECLAGTDVPVVIMHMQGTPETMQDNPTYDDVIEDVTEFFRDRIEWATRRGLTEKQVILDPGIGFGKTLEHNRQLLNHVDQFKSLGRPVLVGHSRKSFLDPILDCSPDQRLSGTLAVSSHLLGQSVDIIRVHDVRAHRDLRATFQWLEEGQNG